MKLLALIATLVLALPAMAQDEAKARKKEAARKPAAAKKQAPAAPGARKKPTPEQIRKFNELQKKQS